MKRHHSKPLIVISESSEECVLQLKCGTRFTVTPIDKMFIIAGNWRTNSAGYKDQT